MGDRNPFWRNAVIGAVIVIAVAGAIWVNGSEGKHSTSSPSPSESRPAPSGPDRTASPADHREERPEEGFTAPDFTLRTLDGKTVELAQNDGKPTLINFWASWCPPCKEEMPHIQKAYEKYGDRVRFLMVNLTALDDRENMERYIRRENFTFPVLLDETGEVGKRYNTFSIPQTYIVNEKGEIVRKIVGAMSKDQLEEIMRQLTGK